MINKAIKPIMRGFLGLLPFIIYYKVYNVNVIVCLFTNHRKQPVKILSTGRTGLQNAK
jgi:hypothetical protein